MLEGKRRSYATPYSHERNQANQPRHLTKPCFHHIQPVNHNTLIILQLTLAKDSDTSDDSSASELEDDDLEMLLLSTLWPSHKDKGVHINYLDIPDQDFENMFR